MTAMLTCSSANSVLRCSKHTWCWRGSSTLFASFCSKTLPVKITRNNHVPSTPTCVPPPRKAHVRASTWTTAKGMMMDSETKVGTMTRSTFRLGPACLSRMRRQNRNQTSLPHRWH